jgi:hypothetical protein
MAIINEFIKIIKNKYFVINTESLINFILKYKFFLNAEILYRNILINNIILIKNENNNFFIDFDFFNKINYNRAFGAPSKINIKIFITIGALIGK